MQVNSMQWPVILMLYSNRGKQVRGIYRCTELTLTQWFSKVVVVPFHHWECARVDTSHAVFMKRPAAPFRSSWYCAASVRLANYSSTPAAQCARLPNRLAFPGMPGLFPVFANTWEKHRNNIARPVLWFSGTTDPMVADPLLPPLWSWRCLPQTSASLWLSKLFRQWQLWVVCYLPMHHISCSFRLQASCGNCASVVR